MIRWIVAIFLLLAVFYPLLPFLGRVGVGRLPGDVRFRFKSLMFCFPFVSAWEGCIVVKGVFCDKKYREHYFD